MSLDACLDCDEYLIVNGVRMDCAAWLVTDLTDLYNFAKRGRDRVIPGSTGVIVNPRRLKPVPMQFPLVVYGDVDRNGVAYADVRDGLLANIEYLLVNVAQVTAASSAGITANWHRADGTTRVATVHVENLEFSQFGREAKTGVLELTVPSGRFV